MVDPVNKKLAKLEGAKLQNILGLPSPFLPIRNDSTAIGLTFINVM